MTSQDLSCANKEEKDTIFKRISRGFNVLLSKLKITGEYIQKNNESKEHEDFFNVNFEEVKVSPIMDSGEKETKKDNKKEKDYWSTDFSNMTNCEI